MQEEIRFNKLNYEAQLSHLEKQKIDQQEVFKLFQNQLNIKDIDDLPEYLGLLLENERDMRADIAYLEEEQEAKYDQLLEEQRQIKELLLMKEQVFRPGDKQMVIDGVRESQVQDNRMQ